MFTLSILALLYFLPTILAVRRGHEITPILLLNLFFGWTVIGWFAMLLWATLSYPPYAYYYPASYYPQEYWQAQQPWYPPATTGQQPPPPTPLA